MLLLRCFGRAEEAEEMENGLASGLTGAWGCSRQGQQRQDARGAWQREQKSGDGWHTRGICCLMAVSHCSVDSVTLRCLTAKLHRVGTANSLLKSEIRQDESCSPKYQLHFMLNDQDLIPKES